MRYPPEAIAELENKRPEVILRLQQQRVRIVGELAPILNDGAKEYAVHGAARRIGVIEHCIQNIFTLFPTTRDRPLGSDALYDVQINLHAFVINVSGLQDNLAWIFILQRGLPVRRHQVDLFKEDTAAALPESIRKHLAQKSMQDWHELYSKDYRDALAHRIPLYVPPCDLTKEEEARYRELDALWFKLLAARDFDGLTRVREEMDRTGSPSPYFVHSFNNGRPPVMLHPQVLTDALTVAELVDLFLDEWLGPEGVQIGPV